ncbi:MAG: BRO family protein [Anaerostipes sp.]|jgi:DNA-damage-inducible protein D
MDFDKELEYISNRILKKALTQDEKDNYTETIFESIKHVNEYGQEFWFARELSKMLEYTEYNKFIPVIKKAITACEKSNYKVANHFAEVSEMVKIGSDALRKFNSYKLSRYACYLIVMNADSRKEIVSLGQTYFAVKTRQQEIIDNFDELEENQKRLAIRYEMKEHNKQLVAAAKDAGVETNYDVGKEVRDTIERLGGTMPEDLPTPDKSIKQLERESKKLNK